jgi:hypothetical protein
MMKKVMKVFWLVFLSVFPITSLLREVELEDSTHTKGRNNP